MDVRSESSQAIHLHMCLLAMNKSFHVSIIYGEHTFTARRSLWTDLVQTNMVVSNEPWLVAGDFNAIRDHSDRMGNSNEWIPAFDELALCLDQAGLDDLKYVGHRFTWSTSSGASRKQRKIDRVLVNDQWTSTFSYSEATFLAPGVSDDTPMIVRIMLPSPFRKPFKFFNCWVSHPSFLPIVTQTWGSRITGTHMDPLNLSLAALEKDQLHDFASLRIQEESFFKQKSRINWLKEGDRNTKYFHHFVNRRHILNRIISVLDDNGSILTEPTLVHNHIVNHFQDLLTSSSSLDLSSSLDIQGVIGRSLNEDQETNATILTLVPKVPNALALNDFRPIACCNTIYKCITKILANRIASVLPSIISPPQNAFVKKRRIGDNILIAQELFAGFHHQPYLAKCAIKLTLQVFGFPQVFIKLLMECVTTPKFSVAINGTLHGFFSSGRGIRQGDPISPYLFTLVMEVFTGILNAHTQLPGFKFFWRCKTTRLTHLFFADDVLLFAEANLVSTTLLKDALDQFSRWSGLKPNVNKSEIFFSGGTPQLWDKILHSFGYLEGHLSGIFSITSAWELVRARGQAVYWDSFIWDCHIAPRHGFLMWLMALNRLPTQNLRWGVRFIGGDSFHQRISRFALGALCHLIWIERNNILFRNGTHFMPALRNHLAKVVRDKGLSFKPVQDNPQNRRIQAGWGISDSIFS
ncbi:uncharacterized protein LOC115676822 [Syzygium oleosum]|uniref:uncharacterized protein LOC115676822 n=1 Tax=Syzygium oleosum TaxID=219896 RepID=UPI0024B910E1|nr:uncharacterized protein LOC115676822 [Syzygium oleosum]